MTTRNWAPAAALFVATALVMSAGLAAAGRPNPNRGKSLFRAGCKTCHQSKGEAKDLSPLTKTQAQWTRAFKNLVPARMATLTAQKTGKALSAEDLEHIQFFLVSHAADSDQPETCGLK